MPPIETIVQGTAPKGRDGDNNRQTSTKVNKLLSPMVGATGLLYLNSGVPSILFGTPLPVQYWPSDIAPIQALMGVLRGELAAQVPTISEIKPNPKNTDSLNTQYLSGNAVTRIQGTGFLTTTSVMVDGVSAPFHIVSDTQIYFQPFPKNSSGSKAVIVTVAANPNGVPATVSTTMTFTSVAIGTTQNAVTVAGAALFNKLVNSAGGNLYSDRQIGTPSVWGMEVPTINVSSTDLGAYFFPTWAAISHVQGLVTGLDGNMWTCDHQGGLYRIQSDLTNHVYEIDRFQIPGAKHSIVDPGGLIIGPDGNVWLVGGTVGSPSVPFGSLWKCTYDGKITQYTFPSPFYYPGVICAGIDGNIWFTSGSGSLINLVQMSVNGQILSVTNLPALTNLVPSVMLVGPDGNFWITGLDLVNGSPNPVRVLRVDPNNIAGATYFPLSTFTKNPNGCVGPDGNLYFCARITGQDSAIVQMDTLGNILHINTVVGSSNPAAGSLFGICTDATGRICAVESGSTNGTVIVLT